MKKRVLLISYYFAPQNIIGAVRTTKFAKYLMRMGYEVTVLCGVGLNGEQDPTLKSDLAELKDVHVIDEFNPLRAYKARRVHNNNAHNQHKEQPVQRTAQQPSTVKHLIHRAANAFYLFLCVLSDQSFEYRAKRELSKLNGTYDVVFSSYAPLSVHNVAVSAKRSGLARYWIADFRDEVNMSFGWQERYRVRYLKMLQKEADVLSAVSNGVLDMMDLKAVGRVLTNGFDVEDIKNVAELPPQEPKTLRIAYCGQFHKGCSSVKNRDITPFFRALRTLVDQGVCKEDELSILYAGNEGAVCTEYAAAFGLGARVTDWGRVTREKSLALQKSADVLLMASWNMAGQTGILTGKLFEYMMMDKPIVCCMSGDLAGSELKQVLETTGMGICCEQANGVADEQALLQHLHEIITRWRQEQPLFLSKNSVESAKFDYASITKELATWINEVT